MMTIMIFHLLQEVIRHSKEAQSSAQHMVRSILSGMTTIIPFIIASMMTILALRQESHLVDRQRDVHQQSPPQQSRLPGLLPISRPRQRRVRLPCPLIFLRHQALPPLGHPRKIPPPHLLAPPLQHLLLVQGQLRHLQQHPLLH